MKLQMLASDGWCSVSTHTLRQVHMIIISVEHVSVCIASLVIVMYHNGGG